MINEVVKSTLPTLTVCARYDNNPLEVGEGTSLHYHDELEFLPIFEGCFHCVVDGRDYSANAGEVIFVNSRVPHATYASSRTRHGLLQFRQSDFISSDIHRIIKYSVKLHDQSESRVRILSIPELYDVTVEVLKEAKLRDTAYDFFVRSGIFRILGILYRHGIISDAEQLYKSKDVQKIIRALSYINEHYMENITLSDLCSELGFATGYLCRIFKSALGATFTEYLNFVRVCKAESLLIKTEKSILEISEEVGFASVSYFNRVFKRYGNCTPSYYRSAKYLAQR